MSFNISKSPDFKQTITMLIEAVEKHLTLHGLILHSNKGWQYKMREYLKALQDKKVVQSSQEKGIVWITHEWKISLES